MEFVDIGGNCKKIENGQDITVDVSELKLSEAFTFGSKDLKGYWVSKYLLQESTSSGLEVLKVQSGENITVTTTAPSGTYTILLDGLVDKEGVTLPYTYTGLDNNTVYDIALYSETNKRMVGATYAVQRRPIVEEIDLSGFNPDCTYYVEYDSQGNLIREDVKIQLDENGKATNIPDGWYDYYNNKIWANLVTMNNDTVTYWTYIPRYEYHIQTENIVDIVFISSKKTKADDGFKIPESFTFGGKDLKGYWVSKYLLQESTSSGLERVVINSDQNITVTTTSPSGTYSIYIDGVKTVEGVELPYTLTGLTSNTTYKIYLYSETNKRKVGEAYGVTRANVIEEIDLSGFNPDCTYYVEYDSEGNLVSESTKIVLDEDGKATNIPIGWYDYNNKIWANLKTDNNGLITYWTYIPRYEYNISSKDILDVVFIPSTMTTADREYKIPESFTFGGQNLKGYWVSKYELQEST